MREPYRWGDVAPPAVVGARQRRAARAAARRAIVVRVSREEADKLMADWEEEVRAMRRSRRPSLLQGWLA